MKQTRYRVLLTAGFPHTEKLQQLMEVKHFNFASIDISNMEHALLEIQQLFSAATKNPNIENDGITLILFGKASELAMPLQSLMFSNIILINPTASDYFQNNITVITEENEDRMLMKLKHQLEK